MLTPKGPTDIYEVARGHLRAEMAKREINIQELSLLLQQIGAPEARRSLAIKIKRGRFSLGFYIQCLMVLGVKRAELDIPELEEALQKGMIISSPRPKPSAEREAEFNKQKEQKLRAERPSKAKAGAGNATVQVAPKGVAKRKKNLSTTEEPA